MERKLSKKMPPHSNSRPPLSSRIFRSSFDKKREIEATSPGADTNGFVTQDPDALRHAIDEAINSETFQNAIAANLAKLIKPSIKSALDTIQPVVEAVYNHEVLLRKTNQSVENILERIDTVVEGEAGIFDTDEVEPAPPRTPRTPRKKANAEPISTLDVENIKRLIEQSNEQTAGKLSELTSSLEANNARVSEVAESVDGLHAVLDTTRTGLVTLEGLLDQSNTNTSVMQAQLDQMKADVGDIISAIGYDLGSNVKTINEHVAAQDSFLLSSHTTKLDTISEDLAALKGQPDTAEILQSISANLESLKESIQVGIASSDGNFATIAPQINNVLSSVGAQSSVLADIKSDDTSADILAAIQKSNDSHAAHAAALEEIKNIAASGPATTPASSDPETLSALQTLIAAVQKSNDSHESHAAILNEIKDRGSGLAPGTAPVNDPETALALQTLLTAIQKSNDAHESHAAVLDELKNRAVGSGDGSNVANDPETRVAFQDLMSAIQRSNESHESHTTGLGEMKDKTTAALEVLSSEVESLRERIDLGLTSHKESLVGVGTRVDDVLTTLEAHRAADPSMEILAAVQKSNISHTSHAAALNDIKPPGVVSIPASDSGSLTDIEPQVAAIISTLKAHTATLEEIKATAVSSNFESPPQTKSSDQEPFVTSISKIIDTLDSHTTLLNEIKDDVSAEILTVLHDINDAHDAQNTVLAEIRESDVSDEILTALHASNDSHTNHTAALEGIYDAIRASNDAQASHSVILAEIKSTTAKELGFVTESSPDPEIGNHEALESKVDTIVATLEEQKVALSAIKEVTNASNNTHAAHAATLAGIRDATTTSNDFHTIHAATLSELQKTALSLNEYHASHSSVLAQLKDAIDFSNELLDAHSTALNEVKDATATSNEFHNSHTASLAELRDISNSSLDAHDVQVSALAETKDAIKSSNDLHASHITALTELNAAQPMKSSLEDGGNRVNLAELDARYNTIIDTLDTLIKYATVNPDFLATIKESQEFMTSIHKLLSSHSSILESIKASSSNEDILANLASLKSAIKDSKDGLEVHGAVLRDLHESTKSSHSEITHAIGALAGGGVVGAGAGMLAPKEHDGTTSAEILEEVKAVRAVVERSSTTIDSTSQSVTSMAAQVDLNHTTVVSNITTLNDELKAEIDASSTVITSSVGALSEEVKSMDLSSLAQAVAESEKDVKGLVTTIEELNGSVQSTGDYVLSLGKGVHLNHKGVKQLTEHASAIGVRAAGGLALHHLDSNKENDSATRKLGNVEEVEESEPTMRDVPRESDATAVVNEAPAAGNAQKKDFSPNRETVIHKQTPEVEFNSEEKVIEEPPVEKSIHEKHVEDPARDKPAIDEPTHEVHVEELVHEEKAIEERIPEAHFEEPTHEQVAEEPPTKDLLVHVDDAAQKMHEKTLQEEQPLPALVHEEQARVEEQITLPSSQDDKIFPAEPNSHDLSTPIAGDEPSACVPEEEDVSEAPETDSASTSAIASPLSPLFAPEGEGLSSGKKGKKGKKEQKEKKAKGGKKEKVPFVFDPEPMDGGEE
jgi:hypothetical protein